MRSRVRHFFLHYGISTILFIMFVAVVYMLQILKIDEKVAVDIIQEHDGKYYCYVPSSVRFDENCDSIAINMYEGYNLSLYIIDWEKEKNFTVCRVKLHSNQESKKLFAQGRKITGYWVVGKIRLGDLVFSKWMDKWR